MNRNRREQAGNVEALTAKRLLDRVRACFDQVPEHRQGPCGIRLGDALMAGLAVFGLKYPSLLEFDEHKKESAIQHNLKTLYGVERAPCDTQLRVILDEVDPAFIEAAFADLHRLADEQDVFDRFQYLDGYHVISVDGTGQFCSGAVSCPQCCIKERSNGRREYYHQLLGAVVVHPDMKTVIPLAPEPILRADGATKNDCERNAAKRLLPKIRETYPHLRPLIVEDSLAANGPHIKLLNSLDFRFIIGVLPSDHAELFEQVDRAYVRGEVEEFQSVDTAGVCRGYRWINGLRLNKSHPEIRVNFLEYWEVDGTEEHIWTWITDVELSRDTVNPVMRAGRARWKVENETFNTLKNQGYHLEHNYGHGQRYLATVFGLLTLLAFLIDQLQEWGCGLFRSALRSRRTRSSFWDRLRAWVTICWIPSWEALWNSIRLKRPVGGVSVPDTS